jgi:hypothetical protein
MGVTQSVLCSVSTFVKSLLHSSTGSQNSFPRAHLCNRLIVTARRDYEMGFAQQCRLVESVQICVFGDGVYLQRFDAERDSVPPAWQQSITDARS